MEKNKEIILALTLTGIIIFTTSIILKIIDNENIKNNNIKKIERIQSILIGIQNTINNILHKK